MGMFSRKDMIRLFGPLLVEQLLAVLVGMADVVMVAAVGELRGFPGGYGQHPVHQYFCGGGNRRRGGLLAIYRKEKAGSGLPGGRTAGADHSGAFASDRGGGIYRKPASAAADLRFGGDGGHGQRADIFLVHCHVVSVSGAL